jgi:hypothetical protein
VSVCPTGGEYGSEGGKADSSPAKVFTTAEELRLLIEARTALSLSLSVFVFVSSVLNKATLSVSSLFYVLSLFYVCFYFDMVWSRVD